MHRGLCSKIVCTFIIVYSTHCNGCWKYFWSIIPYDLQFNFNIDFPVSFWCIFTSISVRPSACYTISPRSLFGYCPVILERKSLDNWCTIKSKLCKYGYTTKSEKKKKISKVTWFWISIYFWSWSLQNLTVLSIFWADSAIGNKDLQTSQDRIYCV